VTWRYDRAGRLTGVSDTSAAIAAAAPPGGTAAEYATATGYDALNRPTGASWSPTTAAAAPGASSSVLLSHTYNAVNQRSGQTVSDSAWLAYPGATPATTSYTANNLNQYTAVGAASPTYDGNGNLTSDGTWTLGYDAENRLTSASAGSTTATYTYDGGGRRKTKTVNGTTTVFVTDADNREVLEYDGSSGAILRWHAYGLGPNAVLGTMDLGTATRTALLPDVLGSTMATMNAGTAALTPVGYLPYGASSTALSGLPAFAFTGRRVDRESGFYYYRARHYSTAWGRFLQSDPAGFQAGTNFYFYANNDPLNVTDPSGNCPSCLLGGILNVGVGYAIAKLTGQEYSLGSAAVDFGVGFVTSGVAVLNAARRGAQIVEGVYVVDTVAGVRYVGQSTDITGRLSQHVASGKITQSAADNALRFEVLGGQTSREIAEQMAINARGGIPSLANKVNPIGGRPSLAGVPGLGVVTNDNLIRWQSVLGVDVALDLLLQSAPARADGAQSK
jgi:RHS repeat-associated protein